MSRATELSDTVSALSKSFKAVIDLGDYLAAIGSIEQAELEATQARDRAIADRDVEVQALADVRGQIGAATGGLDDVRKQADAIVDAARSDAARIVSAAQANADQIAAAASANAAQIEAQSQSASATLAGIQSQVSVARDTLASVNQAIAEIEARMKSFVQ